MKTKTESQAVEVYAGTIWQAEMVKSLLEDAEIEAFLRDEILGTLSPWWVASGGVGSVKVVVSSTDYELAKSIVEEYEKTQEPEQ